MTSARLVNATKNITIARSRFTGNAIVDGVANANILFDANTHVGIMTCPSCSPAMLALPGLECLTAPAARSDPGSATTAR